MEHLVSRLLWYGTRGYILWNVHIAVMCVI